MSREICNECLGRQRRDGGSLTKLEREKLVHRWRLSHDSAEHFRRDCRWWPKDGSAFGQRGIDTRTHIGGAGASHVGILAGIAGGYLASVWVVLAQTTFNVDVALILMALTPIIGALGALYQIVKKAKAATDEIHTIIDGERTLGREEKLFEMQERRLMLSRLVQKDAAPEDISLLHDLDKRIEALRTEIETRKATVAALPSSATPKLGGKAP